MTMNELLAPLSDDELDVLTEHLISGGQKLERHTSYVYNRVPEDYLPALETWRENSETVKDVLAVSRDRIYRPAAPDLSAIMAYEAGELDETETIILFQSLVNSGLAWRLQGHYGRTAAAMIEEGLVTR